jgi:hypothetical protein
VIDRIAGFISRTLFVVAFILGGLAVWEKLANMTGRTLAFLRGFTPARLVELTVVLLLFVIALELRAIMHRESATNGPGQDGGR